MTHDSQTPAVVGHAEPTVRPPCRSATGDTMLCANAACGWLGRCLSAEPQNGAVLPLMIGQVSRSTDVAVHAMDAAFVAAIEAAKDAGVPQGLIVALLHGHAHRQTASMMDLA